MPGGRPTHFGGDLRAALLDAAEREIAENGIEAVSLRSIARRVGVSHAAPAHHFGDFAGLMTAVAVRSAEELDRSLRAAVSSIDDPVEQLAELGRAYVRFARERPALFALFVRPEKVHADDAALRSAEAAAFDTLRRHVRSAMEHGWATARERGSGGTRAGAHVDVDVDVDTLAVLAWSTVHGLAVLLRDARLPAPHGHAAEEAKDEMVATITRAFVDLGRRGAARR